MSDSRPAPSDSPRPKLAFSTNAFTRHPLEYALDHIAAAGFAGVEILADKPHAWPTDLTPRTAGDVRRQLDRLNLAISNVNANCSFGYWKDAPPEPYFEPSLISPNPQHRKDRIDLIKRTLRFAAAIEAPNVSITSGRCLGGMPPDKAAAQFIDSMNFVLDEADAVGVNVGVELEPGLFLEYVDELRDWIAGLNHPRFGANLDIGHSVVIGETIEHAVTTLAGRIWNMHVEDLPGRKHYHMIPGEGTFDFPGLKSSLAAIAYDRFLTVELYTHTAEPAEAARKSYAFLSRVFN